MKLQIWDATGNKKVQVDAPQDVVVGRVLVVLVGKLNLPKYNPAGEFMSYKLHHQRLGIQLLDNKTLEEQSVEEDDVMRIIPEITAGSP